MDEYGFPDPTAGGEYDYDPSYGSSLWAGYGKETATPGTVWDWEQGRRVPIGQTMADQRDKTPFVSSMPSNQNMSPFYRNQPGMSGGGGNVNTQQTMPIGPPPTMSTPIAPPKFKTLKDSSNEIQKEWQTQAAPGISKLRQALQHASAVAANEDNPARRRVMLRSLMEGAGTGISDIMGSSYDKALRTVGTDISIANQATGMAYQTAVNQATQLDAAKLGMWGNTLTKLMMSTGI
jgi:hypothetical protein